jgi:hypothetical protein
LDHSSLTKLSLGRFISTCWKTRFFSSIEDRLETDRLIFQQDGAPAHYDVRVRDFLDNMCTWIGRRGDIEWPPRSPDLTVPDFFLWGYLKDKIFSRSPKSTDKL